MLDIEARYEVKRLVIHHLLLHHLLHLILLILDHPIRILELHDKLGEEVGIVVLNIEAGEVD